MKIYRAEDNAPVELEPLLLDDPLVANAATKVGWELLQRPDTDELGDFIGRQMAGFNNQPTASPDPQYTQVWGTREAARACGFGAALVFVFAGLRTAQRRLARRTVNRAFPCGGRDRRCRPTIVLGLARGLVDGDSLVAAGRGSARC